MRDEHDDEDWAHVIVSFTILSAKLDPEHVTESLQLTPTATQRAHGPKRPAAVRKYASWSLHSPLPHSCTIEEHLKALLEVLEPKVRAIKLLADSETEMKFYGSIYKSHQINISFGKDILTRVLSIGARIDISCYHSRPF